MNLGLTVFTKCCKCKWMFSNRGRLCLWCRVFHVSALWLQDGLLILACQSFTVRWHSWHEELGWSRSGWKHHCSTTSIFSLGPRWQIEEKLHVQERFQKRKVLCSSPAGCLHVRSLSLCLCGFSLGAPVSDHCASLCYILSCIMTSGSFNHRLMSRVEIRHLVFTAKLTQLALHHSKQCNKVAQASISQITDTETLQTSLTSPKLQINPKLHKH